MRALVPATASTSAAVAVAMPERWPDEIQRHPLGGEDARGAGPRCRPAPRRPASGCRRAPRPRMRAKDPPAETPPRPRSGPRWCRACAPPARAVACASAGMVRSLVMSPARPRSSSSARAHHRLDQQAARRPGEVQRMRRSGLFAVMTRRVRRGAGAVAAIASASARVMKRARARLAVCGIIAAPMAAARFRARQRAGRHQLAPPPAC